MNRIEENFLNYISNFDLSVKGNKLKLNHTYRVAQNCKEISELNNFNEKEINLAIICGYLHDIGRFLQLKKYGTFIDKDSYDHGDLGYEILKKDNFIELFEEDKKSQEIILNSVKYHNKLNIPNDLDELSTKMLKVVRDADKLDIYELIIDGDIFIKTNGEDISNYAFNAILENQCIDRNHKKTNKDRILTWVGFIYDFNYDCSLQIVKDNKYIEKLLESYKDNNISANTRLEIIEEHVLEYIEKKVGKKNVRKKIQSSRGRKK